MSTQITEETLASLKKDVWESDGLFPFLTALLAAAAFAGTHMYYLYHVGAFNDISVVALLKAGLDGGNYGAAAAFGASFLFARILEGSLVGILDIGGSMHTGIGIGIPALLLSMGVVAPLKSFPLALLTGAALGLIMGYIIIAIKKLTVGRANSTFGVEIMMGAGNSSGRFLGPLIVISACSASFMIGTGAVIGGALFYLVNKPVAGGAILGAMIFGILFPVAM